MVSCASDAPGRGTHARGDATLARGITSRQNQPGGEAMSFVVSCTCGKQFRVADESRGKKAKCKGCGATLVLVPQEERAAVAPPPPTAADEGGGDDPFANIDW